MDGGGATWSSEGYQHYSNNKTTTILNNLITTSSLKQLSILDLQPYYLQPLLLGAARALMYPSSALPACLLALFFKLCKVQGLGARYHNSAALRQAYHQFLTISAA